MEALRKLEHNLKELDKVTSQGNKLIPMALLKQIICGLADTLKLVCNRLPPTHKDNDNEC